MLLQAPRDPEGLRSYLLREYLGLADELGLADFGIPAPFVAVGEYSGDEGSELHIMLRNEAHIDAKRFEYALERRDLLSTPLRLMVSGVITPADRPARGGDSVGLGRKDGPTGTLACMVADKDTGIVYLLSCCHVLTDPGSPAIGAILCQPGSKDGGYPNHRIGTLARYEPIAFGGHVANRIDAALGLPDSVGDLLPGIREIGEVHGFNPSPPHRAVVQKFGKATKRTTGVLRYKDMSFILTLRSGEALFARQYCVVAPKGRFAQEGDSGALVVDEQQAAIGLVFAIASDLDLTFVNPIGPIVDRFSIQPS